MWEIDRDLIRGGHYRQRSGDCHAPDPIESVDEALRRFRMPQGRVELVKRPIYFVAGDHQRRTDTDGVVMGVLT